MGNISNKFIKDGVTNINKRDLFKLASPVNAIIGKYTPLTDNVGGGTGSGETLTGISFDPFNDIITVASTGGSFNTPVSLDSEDIPITKRLDNIGNQSFPAGTPLQTVLEAIENGGGSGGGSNISVTNSNSPFSFDFTSQILNIPKKTGVIEESNGDITFSFGDGSAPLTIKTEDNEWFTSTIYTIDDVDYPVGTTGDVIIEALINKNSVILFKDFIVINNTHLASSNNPTDQDAQNYVDANDAPNTKIIYVGTGTTLNPQWLWATDQDETVVRIKPIDVESNNSSSDIYYSCGNGGHVLATGLGVTLVKDTTAGTYSFEIPSGVIIKYAKVNGTAIDGDSGNEIFVNFKYLGARSFNNSMVDRWQPKVTVSNGNATVSRSSPAAMDLNLIQGISKIGAGELELVLSNATTFYSSHVIDFYFV